jgi:hypothetical protein
MNHGILKLFSVFILFISLNAREIGDYSFDLIKKGSDDNNTLLIIGGIQGDEPGGFMAASLLSTHYEITKGSVWIIPNLAFYSIIKRGRGVYGDMNRKFALISPEDKDYKTVQRVKEIIKDKNVKVVVNMHDGSGFYRKKYVDKMHNPYKWGQCVVIDQREVKNIKYGNLESIAKELVTSVNQNLLKSKKKEDIFHLHNTYTAKGNTEMLKTLTYYAITQNKSAFGIESTKNYPVSQRVYYKMVALEKLMDVMGIEYKRKYKLTDYGVKQALNSDIYLNIGEKLTLLVSNATNSIKYLPVQKDIKFQSNNPLVTIINKGKYYQIRYGNRFVSNLFPQYIKWDKSLKSVDVEVDNIFKRVDFGEIVEVENSFKVHKKDGIRVNVIGFTKSGLKNEAGVKITEDSIYKQYSIDKHKKSFRVEVYKGDKFGGMFVVKFVDRLFAKK